MIQPIPPLSRFVPDIVKPPFLLGLRFLHKFNGRECGLDHERCDAENDCGIHVRAPPLLLIRSILQDDPLDPQIYDSRREDADGSGCLR
jgi:hypothetical protein